MSDLVKTNQFEEQKAYLQTLIDSKKLPVHIKAVEDAFTIAEYGRELGFPIIQSFNYIIMIQGRPTLSATAIGAILKNRGIKYKCTEDALWVYPDGSTSTVNDGKALDRRTTVIFTRDGEEEIVTYTMKDAMAAGYMDKDNWKRMFKEMSYSRCVSKGSRRVAPDYLMGLYSADEIIDSTNPKNIRVVRDEDGTVKQVIEVEYSEA